MSPRGYYSKEYINPYFTSEKYINSPMHDQDIERVITMENRLRSWFGYPRKLAMRVWIAILVWSGYIKDLTK